MKLLSRYYPTQTVLSPMIKFLLLPRIDSTNLKTLVFQEYVFRKFYY